MTAPAKKAPLLRLDPEQRRALKMLASSGPSGLTKAILLAHGFSNAMLDGITRAGLAAVAIGAVRAGGSTIAVLRFQITAAGRKAVDEASPARWLV